MVKGIQKQVVMVRLNDSESFETAYFVLRDGYEKKESADIVGEANALVRDTFLENGEKSDKRRKRCKRPPFYAFMLFFAGLISGGALACIPYLFV